MITQKPTMDDLERAHRYYKSNGFTTDTLLVKLIIDLQSSESERKALREFLPIAPLKTRNFLYKILHAVDGE